MVGLWTELGPLLLNDLSTADGSKSVPVPQYNPYSWTRLGHLLILNQPAPVGFSYCNDDPLGHNCGDIKWTDELTSAAAYQAFQAVLKLFPCLASLDLYLTGESYGGMYCHRHVVSRDCRRHLNLVNVSHPAACAHYSRHLHSHVGTRICETREHHTTRICRR